ncbi:DUF616 domain-containing protein [Butyrivibrio sp. CB08]|uniref:glycosyltransferase domain-containing protein n=1 Tax=Butyrivibrio sp. CB08 TaxID=2364879 RepID=UPI000EAA7D09|nr:glycosyltransferase domain-containing protein [Butyrivibrio sp. CB08]RKM60420.1 DUF616 domain-containing protein [Butyrivibrio sp. CB08]
MTNRAFEEVLNLIKNRGFKVCIFGCGDIGVGCGYQRLIDLGITVHYYCDNNTNLWGKTIKDGILCFSVDELDIKNTVFFVLTHDYYELQIVRQLQDLGADSIISWTDLCSYKSHERLALNEKIAIYTCIIGGYDELRDPVDISDDCDYFCISDDENTVKNSVYKFINIRDLNLDQNLSDTKKNRYVKINAHKVFPDYRYSVYFDGNVQLSNRVIECFSWLPKTRIIARSRNNTASIYTEAIKRLETKRDDASVISRQVQKYWKEGMPEDFGGVNCGILVREHNHPICKMLMETWWEQVNDYSNRDQISFPYVLWKHGFSFDDVGIISETLSEDSDIWNIGGNHKKSFSTI